MAYVLLAGRPGIAAAERGAPPLPAITQPADQPDETPLSRARSDLARAHGVEKYAALRKLWRLWDQVDPAAIEDGIRAIETDRAEPPDVRAYAGVLSAYARRRRGDLEGASRKMHALGLVDQWLVLGPFDNEGRSGFEQEFAPEQEGAEPLTLTRLYDAKEHPVRWRKVPDVYHFGWLDFGDLMRPSQKVCAYATTFLRSKTPTVRRPISLWIGAGGAFKAIWNGTEVLRDPVYRALDTGRMGARVEMLPGWNRLTAKVCSDDEGPLLSVRVADTQGEPDDTIEVSADPSLGATSVKNRSVATGGKGSAVRSATGGLGPLQRLLQAAESKKSGAVEAERLAEYLLLTTGDDPVLHQALAQARRAAEAAPTVTRALRVAELSVDRNQRRDWIERAQKLSGKSTSVPLLLAEGDLARTGPNWRDAPPYYEKVLAADPRNVSALLGQVDLYNEAGLAHAALATLERATVADPSSVALLRAYSKQLRQLGRAVEADEVADRYSALRFDDNAWLSDRVELAVLRRDTRSATHWVDRLLSVNPDSTWALGASARAYRALGDERRALAFYQRALDLCPDDVETLRALADLQGERGERDTQLKLLRQILALRPQQKDIREYVENIEPPKPRVDEAYAWPPEKFLALREKPANGETKRTLRELQVTTVFPNGLATHFRQVIFQPLTDEAAAAAREYGFAYQADSEAVQLRSAKVYRKGGKVDEAIESGEGAADDPALAMYTSGRTFFVHFPRLSAGDVVELRYRVEDVALRNEFADYFGEVNYLQGAEPVGSVEYVLRTPKSRPLYVHSSSLPGLVRKESVEGDTRVYSFAASSVPPVPLEPAMPPATEVLAYVHVSTYKTWDDVARWYRGLARDQMVADEEIRNTVRELTSGLTDPPAKARAIYDYVVQKTRYVALEFGIYGYKPRACVQTFARGWGDCKDKAALIVTMLHEAGIPASMVLVRSGLRGDFSPQPPSLAPFDHAIAYVPSLDLFLDGTAEYTGSSELPAFDRGALALIVSEDGKGKLVHLPDPPPEATTRSRKVEATLSADGSAQVDVHIDLTGAFASEARQRYHAKGTRRERLAQDMAAAFQGYEAAAGTAAAEVNDLEDIEQPVKVRTRGRALGLGRREGDELSVGIGPLERLTTMFASLSQRRQDVRLRTRSQWEDELSFALPPGTKVKSLPDPTEAKSPFGSYRVTVESSDRRVLVRTKLVLDKTRITPIEYPAFRSFCAAVDQALGQRVVLQGGK